MRKERLSQMSEGSQTNFNIIGYVVGACVSLSGLFFIYEIIANADLTFSANWNMFKSPLGSICMGIGLICALVFWGKFGHWSRTPVLVTKDAFGNVEKVERHYDMIETMFWTILFPFMGHFIIEPMIYGALIYYPIQCIIAVVGSIFPYVLSLLVLGVIAGSWKLPKLLQINHRSIALAAIGLFLTGAFAGGGYAIADASSTGIIDVFEDPHGKLGEDETGQFKGYGEEGLFGSLPDGTIVYEGDMEGYPIEFIITKTGVGDVTGLFKNIEYGTAMSLSGESLPSQGGDVSFYGKDSDADWVFNLTGNVDNVTGTAVSGETELKLTLHRK